MLDGGPSRGAQPVGNRRSVPRQSTPVRRDSYESGSAEFETSPPSSFTTPPAPTAVPSGAQSGQRRWLRPLVIGLALILLLAAGWATWSMRPVPAASVIDSSKYQAVFLATGDKFFGKLKIVDDQHIKLTRVFYVEGGEADAKAEADDNVTRIRPLVDQQMYGPEDEIIINRDQVLFILNLKPDGRASQAMKEYWLKQGN